MTGVFTTVVGFTETGDAVCTCGNTTRTDGFSYCLPDGSTIEPTLDGSWHGHYRCDRCQAIGRSPAWGLGTPCADCSEYDVKLPRNPKPFSVRGWRTTIACVGADLAQRVVEKLEDGDHADAGLLAEALNTVLHQWSPNDGPTWETFPILPDPWRITRRQPE